MILRILFDASALINLVNGDKFAVVLSLPDREWFVGPLVVGECAPRNPISDILTAAILAGNVNLLDDSESSGGAFLNLLERFDLGNGETECLTFAAFSDFTVCCDDRKARSAMLAELGPDRVTGSLGLLKDAVKQELASVEEAYEAYIRMKGAGGFLPNIGQQFFADP